VYLLIRKPVTIYTDLSYVLKEEVLIMLSYATIEGKENELIRLEVEKVPYLESRVDDQKKETYMVTVSRRLFNTRFQDINYGDVFIVAHQNNEIFFILSKSAEEKSRRVEYLNSFL